MLAPTGEREGSRHGWGGRERGVMLAAVTARPTRSNLSLGGDGVTRSATSSEKQRANEARIGAGRGGMSATIKDWLLSAEYILQNGNFNVILCERGIRTFESETRFTLDMAAVPVIKNLSHLPIVIDPSHSTGKWGLVPSMAKAAVAAGADGLIIEVHAKPEEALCDGPQSMLPEKFGKLMENLRRIAKAVGREI